MIKPKKPIAFVCAAALLLSPTGALGASPSDFVDFPNDWSQGAMTAAVENGLLGGVGDGRIAPRGEVTRAQMAAIINRAFGAEKQASLSSYSDVAADAWYAVDMAKAVQMGTFSGTGNGLLEPDRAITREEAFSVLARAFALEAGDGAALNDFTDGAQVSAWARGSVSAMVAGGYVNGSDGNRLNPKQTITRAEFAAVMSKIVAQYIDAEDVQKSRSLSIDGNVIVRGNVDLSGYTINGDVIIADAADAVSLSGVTVTGRLVVRGASESLSVEDSSISGVILTNPHGAAVLDVDDKSDLGTVNALSDFTLAGGSLDKLSVAASATITVENDASIGEITVNADDVTVTGDGKVDKVQANGDDVHVDVADTEVTAAKGTSGVTAGNTIVEAGESATVGETGDSDDGDKNPGSTDGSTGGNTGGSSTGGNTGGSTGGSTGSSTGGSTGGSTDGTTGGTTGGSETTDPTPGGETEEAATLVNAQATKLVDLGWSQYVTVQFAEGHNLNNTTLTIDGTDVTSAFTPVTDDGSIVKWEITDLNPAQLVATSDGESQSVTLSDNPTPEKPEVVKAEDSAADYIIAHGPVAYWDFHLTNYDKDGNVRVEPSKTTFNLSGEEDSDVPAYYSANAELSENGGNVVIQFAYESAEDKAWFDAAATKGGDVELVSFDERKSTLNKSLNFKKGTGTSEFAGNVGIITIPLNQDNFRSNGRYYVRIISEGHDTALIPIHVVNATAPELQLSEPDALTSGKDIHFTVKNMTYGITVPIELVELTDPTGATTQLEKITDWYLFGETFVLYNDNNNNNIPYSGPYTLTVHSNGFKDMTYTFEVSGGQEVPTAANYGIDALSGATSSVGSDGEGGGGAISANLKFDVDLLANALLLDKLDLANDAAQGIADRWKYDMAGVDTIHTEDGTAYNFTDFRDAVSQAKTKNNDYLTFAEYIKTADKDTTGTPYAIKTVLEDNLLGETQNGGTWVGMTPPALTLVNDEGAEITAVQEGDQLILKANDKGEYFKALESIRINNNSLELNDDKWDVDEAGTTLTIENSELTIGEANMIVLYADGYKANTLSIRYNKDLEEITGLTLDKASYNRGENVKITVDGSTGDFLENLETVTVTMPDGSTKEVLLQGQGGSDYYYTISEGNVLTIVDNDGTLFAENSDYSVSLSAKYYTMQTTDKFSVDGELKAVPQAAITGRVDEDNNLTLNFNPSDFSWRNAVAMTVNDVTYENAGYYTPGNNQFKWSEHNGGMDGSWDLYIDNAEIDDGNNTILLKAPGYEALTLTVNISDGTVTVSGNEAPEEPETPVETLKVPSYEWEKGSFGGGHKIYFEKTSDNPEATAYLTKVAESGTVTVGSTTYTQVSNTWNETNAYKVQNGNGPEKFIELTTDGFSDTENTTVTIKVAGYEDLVLTIDKDGNVTSTDPGEET